MKLTVQWIDLWFQEFNRRYFNDELPLPRFYVSKSRTRLGSLAYKKSYLTDPEAAPDFRLRLSCTYDLDEREYQNILLHEMIHLYIASKRIHDSSAHGHVFCQIRDELNSVYGWNITNSVNLRHLKPVDNQYPNTQYLVLALKLETGECVLSVVSRKHAQMLSRQLQRAKGISSYGWYVTKDTYFADFPRVRTLRGRRIPKEEFEKKVEQLRQTNLFTDSFSI